GTTTTTTSTSTSTSTTGSTTTTSTSTSTTAPIDCNAVRCSLQSQFDSQCPCSLFTSHSAYVDCIHNVIVASGFAKDCNSAILNCMANSTCGQGASAVTCTEKNGKCDVRPSAAQCTGAGGTVRSSTNCCPSCGGERPRQLADPTGMGVGAPPAPDFVRGTV